MKVQTKRDEEFIDIDKITIRIDSVDFRISVNKFGDLVVNKFQNGDGESAVIILPNVSRDNEVRVR